MTILDKLGKTTFLYQILISHTSLLKYTDVIWLLCEKMAEGHDISGSDDEAVGEPDNELYLLELNGSDWHQNISEKELNKGGLHLNLKGNQQFFKNFQMSLG